MLPEAFVTCRNILNPYMHSRTFRWEQPQLVLGYVIHVLRCSVHTGCTSCCIYAGWHGVPSAGLESWLPRAGNVRCCIWKGCLMSCALSAGSRAFLSRHFNQIISILSWAVILCTYIINFGKIWKRPGKNTQKSSFLQACQV